MKSGSTSIPFADAHCHANPIRGLGAKLVGEKFKKIGGWFVSLVMLPSWDYGEIAKNKDEYKKYVLRHIKECEDMRAVGLKVACFAGFHPAEIDKLINRGMRGIDVYSYATDVLSLLFKLCEEGKLQGVGELGRQHYKSSPESIVIAQRLLEYAVQLGKETGCPLQLHLENKRGFTAFDIKMILEKTSVYKKDNVLIHHARPGLLEEVLNQNIWATTPGIKQSLEVVFKRIGYGMFMIESDFIDDPNRPGTVVYPWDMVSFQKELLGKEIVDEKVLEKLNIDNIVKFFGIDF